MSIPDFMGRPEILEAARKCVCGEREQDYGRPEDNFKTIGRLWRVYLQAALPELREILEEKEITPKDVAVMMALLKVARAATGNSADTFVDLAGYAACAGEIATQSAWISANSIPVPKVIPPIDPAS